MTAVQITFRYQGPFRPELLPRTQEYHGYYGIRQMKVDPDRNLITVEYDATRLDPNGVEAVLRRVGLPVLERVVG